tara:strand:- start:593 stop:721 length:129 start_codon:yes stop_codon:yes gene_type:complete
MLIPLWKNYVEESEVNANHGLTVKVCVQTTRYATTKIAQFTE